MRYSADGRNSKRRNPKRHGMTLLEVVFALFIFMISILAIGQLLSFSGQSALNVSQQTDANLRAQSKMNELIAGVEPLADMAGGYSAFPEEPDWEYSISAQQATIANLWDVTVKIRVTRPSGDVLESTLSQKVLAPQSRGSTLPTLPTNP